MQADLERILFDETTIHRRLDELAAKISNDYRERELTIVEEKTNADRGT